MNSLAVYRSVRCIFNNIRDGIRRDLYVFVWRRQISTACFTNLRNLHTGVNETYKRLHSTHLTSVRSRFISSLSVSNVRLEYVNVTSRYVTVTYSDGTTDKFPFLWLRDNCQCEECFNHDSLARSFLMKDLRLDITPKSAKVNRICLILFETTL